MFALLITKLLQKTLQIVHRGGSLPGQIGLALQPDFIERFKMPKIVILVTGTNGKTTTNNLIAQTLRKSGLKVINNVRGDNLNVGIATLLAKNSNLRYEIQADAAVIEVDELTLYRQFHHLHPTHLVVNNFFRDQLDRAGEMETIIRKIMEVTKDFEGTLILNGDDPNVIRIGENASKAKLVYFHIEKTNRSQTVSQEASEGKFCPRCHHPLHYRYYQYSHIGSFYCEHDDFGQQKPTLTIDHVDFEKGTFQVGDQTYTSFINAIYAIYNCAAVLTVCQCLKISGKYAQDVFAHFVLHEGRNEKYSFKRESIINLVKNPTGANEVMKYIADDPREKNICIFLNDLDQDGHDISWIWDAHFEWLTQCHVKQIICSGRRAYDMALRLKYEGITNITVIEDAQKAIMTIAKADEVSHVIATYTALHATRAIMKKEASKWN